MAKCNEIISYMIMIMNIKAAMQILKKICTVNTLFSSIILTICNVDIIIIDTIKIRRGIIGKNFGKFWKE